MVALHHIFFIFRRFITIDKDNHDNLHNVFDVMLSLKYNIIKVDIIY